jgi:teichuronic acid exporter
VSVGQKVISAIGWSAGIKVAFQLVTWAMTLAVIRILSPNDYGLMAISQVFINVMLGFANLGLGDALVQRENTPRAVVASVFGLLILVSMALTVLLSLAAYPIASWYHDPRLVPLVQVASLGFLFSGLTTLPRVFLMKSLRIRPMFITEVSSGLIGSMAVIALAYTGHGVWSLMLGWLVSNVVRLIGLSVLAAEHYVWPSLDLGLVQPLISYGIFRMLEYLAYMAFTSADVLIIGRWLGPTDLGLYTVALNFAGMPVSKIAPIINSVAFPAFAMVQAQPAEARFYALKAMRLMATVSVPIFFGISAIAPEIVDVVFGPKWLAAEPMLAVLSPAMAFRAILLVIPNFLQGIGDARAGFWCTAAGVVIFPLAFLVGCHWGIRGVCYAWVLGYPVMFGFNAFIASRHGKLSVKAMLMIPPRPILAGAAMIAAVTALRPYLLPLSDEALRVPILIVAGAATYCAVMILAFRSQAMEMISLLRILRGTSPLDVPSCPSPPWRPAARLIRSPRRR